MKRILLLIIGLPLLLIVLAAILVPVLVDEERLIALASSQLEKATGAQLEVDGPVSLSYFPRLALDLSAVTVETPEGAATLEAGELGIGLAVLPLFRGSAEIDAITLRDLTVTSVIDEAAAAREMSTVGLSRSELDALYAKRSEALQAGRANAGAGAALALPLALEVAELSIENARLITQNTEGETLSTVELRQLSARDLNTAGRPVLLSASVVVPGSDGADDITLELDGDLRPDLDAGRVALARLEVVAGGVTREPLELHLDGSADIESLQADLNIAFTVEQMLGNGTLRYAAFESPQIDADLSVNEFNPALLALAGPEAAAAGSAPEDSGDGSALLPFDALRSIDTAARLSIDSVVLGQHTLRGVEARLRALNGRITLEPVNATLHGGDIEFRAELDARYQPASLSSSGSVTELDIPGAVRAAGAPVNATGSATLTWELDAEGDTPEALTASLSGPIRLRTAGVGVDGVNVQQQFCQAVALVNQESLTATFTPDTRFETLEADINLAGGVARLEPLSATLPAVNLTGNGTLDLRSQDLRASIRAQIRDAAGLDPACRVNERIADLRWPVECRGNLADDPATWCSVDTSEIIKDLAEGEVKRRVEKEAGKFLQRVLGGKKENEGGAD
jgi:uncharacterized protein involved in outer membrane biogenesis